MLCKFGSMTTIFLCENEINVKMKFMDFARRCNRPKPRSSLGNEHGFFGPFIGLRAKQGIGPCIGLEWSQALSKNKGSCTACS